MPTPAKPFEVLVSEHKSHRSKAELKARENGEKALSSEQKIEMKSEVKKNKIAKKEFKRIINLLANIKKDDALYENVINRYAVLYAECYDLEEKREECYKLIFELREEVNKITKNIEYTEEIVEYKLEYAKEIAKMMSSMLAIDKQIQSKRKMLLEIEKENIMTIASQLRSIPKKVNEEENPLLKVLRGEA